MKNKDLLRLKQIIKEEVINIIKGLEAKESTNGIFMQTDFYDNDEHIGFTNIKIKKGWNQFHIQVYDKFQRQGYAKQMFEYNINKYNYIVNAEGRITNPVIYKIIDSFKKNPKYEVFDTNYDETVISNKKLSKNKILDILK